MDNKSYLNISYFAVTGVCLGLGWIAYLWLRRSLEGIAQALPPKGLADFLRRAFPLSTILFVLSACLSVNYYGGCNPLTYDKIVANGAYIISKNEEQISESLKAVALGVAMWGGIVVFALLIAQRGAHHGEGKPKEKGEQD